MADIPKVKRNIQRMIDGGASEAEIDQYVASEGTTPEELRAAPAKQQGPGFLQSAADAAFGMTPLGIGKQIYDAARDPAATLQKADDSVRSIANGMSLGFMDKFAGAMGGGVEAERAKSAEAKQRLGSIGDALEIGGSMLPVSKLAKMGVTATRLPGMIGRGVGLAADGAAYGALNAAGHDQNIGTGAAVGAAFGGAGQLAGKAVGAGVRYFKPPAATAEALEKTGEAAFKKADAAGVVFKPQGIARLRDTLYQKFAERGFHPENEPGAAVAFRELERLSQGGPVDLKGIQTLRRVVQNGFRPGNNSNNSLVAMAVKEIDDFAGNPMPGEVLMGDAMTGSAALKEGRDFWHRKSKMEKVDELLGKAETRAGSTGSGGNVENASRQNLRRILDSEKTGRGFTRDEKQAIEKAVIGSRGQGVARLAGKLSPSGNGLMAALLMGGSIAAPHIAIPAAGVGYVSKKISEAMTRNSAKNVKDLIAVGGNKANLPKSLTPEQQKLIDKMARLLAIGGTSAVTNP